MISNLPGIITNLVFFEEIPSYIVIVFFVLIVSLFLILIVSLIERRRGDYNTSEELGEDAYENALKILDKARVDSLRVMSRAQSRAQDLMDNTYSLTDKVKKELDARISTVYKNQEDYLRKSVEELLRTFKSAVEKGKEENIRTLIETTETLKKEALSDISEFKEMLEDETFEAKEELENKVKSDYAEVEREIDTYRQDKLKDLNNKVLDILSNIYLEVIGKELDQPKYENMVLKLLDEEIRKSGLRNVPSSDQG